MDKITFCIPSKSNLQYLKTCIPSIRENAYRKDHDIIIFVDSDEDGTVEWLENVKDTYNLTYYINPELGKKLYGIGKAYDYCIKKSNTDVFMIFHADMILGKDADLNAFKHLQYKTVVCSTRIEPPIHPNAGEKILMDFGMYPEEFKSQEFLEYVQKTSFYNKDKTTEGVFAPWMMYKTDFLKIGGHDAMLHSCREDSDVFNRMFLIGYVFTQSWDSFVYHFTGRGAGSFGGDANRHEQWKRDMNNSTKEFIRKWGSNVKHTAMMKPIVSHKYNIHAILKNSHEYLVELLEPWFSCIYVDTDVAETVYIYYNKEQHNTKFDLTKRIKLFDKNSFSMDSIDILVEIDGSRFTQYAFNVVQNLSDILTETNELGEFELDCLRITVTNLRTYENELIVCNTI